MDRVKINNVVADILCNDGPDGHCDGSDVIADFIVALNEGRGEEWVEKYFSSGKQRTFTKK